MQKTQLISSLGPLAGRVRTSLNRFSVSNWQALLEPLIDPRNVGSLNRVQQSLNGIFVSSGVNQAAKTAVIRQLLSEVGVPLTMKGVETYFETTDHESKSELLERYELEAQEEADNRDPVKSAIKKHQQAMTGMVEFWNKAVKEVWSQSSEALGETLDRQDAFQVAGVVDAFFIPREPVPMEDVPTINERSWKFTAELKDRGIQLTDEAKGKLVTYALVQSRAGAPMQHENLEAAFKRLVDLGCIDVKFPVVEELVKPALTEEQEVIESCMGAVAPIHREFCEFMQRQYGVTVSKAASMYLLGTDDKDSRKQGWFLSRNLNPLRRESWDAARRELVRIKLLPPHCLTSDEQTIRAIEASDGSYENDRTIRQRLQRERTINNI